jgi:hypothetical protein
MRNVIAINLDGSDAVAYKNNSPLSEVQVRVSGTELLISGIPQLDKLEYVARNTKEGFYVVVHRPRVTTDERYVRLHLGGEEKMIEPFITKVCFDVEGWNQIYYRLRGETRALWIRDNTISIPGREGTVNLDRLFIAS